MGYRRVGIHEGESGDIGGWGYRRVEKQEGGIQEGGDTGGWGIQEGGIQEGGDTGGGG